MNTDQRGKIARRPFLFGALGLAAAGVAGGLFYAVPKFLARRYPPTPYDDLLTQLDDRDSAARLGDAVVAAQPRFDAKAAAEALRQGPGKVSLKTGIDQDVAAGRLTEVRGWLLPETLAMAAGIAARAR
jgi:hypothetical protein